MARKKSKKKEEPKIEVVKPDNNPMDILQGIQFNQVNFPEDQYYKVQFPKKQIYLHHTASGEGARGDINHWLSNPQRIATCIIIDREGVAWQCFTSKYWAHHLGVKNTVFHENSIQQKLRLKLNGNAYIANNEILNQESIGVELDSWGGLEKIGDKYYSWAQTEVPEEHVHNYNDYIRGYKYYEKYTDKQITTLKKLLLYWHKVYSIPLDYNIDMWDVSKEALQGKAGIYTHTSVREDKSDCHPQPELIKMLKSLKDA